MAGHKELNMVELMLKCNICFKVITDHKQIQCQHVFCLQCLITYGENRLKKTNIECPVCSNVCPIPNGNVHDLPVSHLHTQLMKKHLTDNGAENIREDHTQIRCSVTQCSKPGVAFCKTCRYICADCKNDHIQVLSLQSHVTMSMGEGLDQDKNELLYCPDHPDKLVDLLCFICEMPICGICRYLYHNQHQCVYIPNKAEEAKKELIHVQETMNSYLDTFNKMAKSVHDHDARLRETSEAIKLKALNIIEETDKQLARRSEAIEEAANRSYGYTKLALRTALENPAIPLLKCLKIYTDQLLQYGSHYDMITYVTFVREKLQEIKPDHEKLTLPSLDSTEACSKINDFKVGLPCLRLDYHHIYIGWSINKTFNLENNCACKLDAQKLLLELLCRKICTFS